MANRLDTVQGGGGGGGRKKPPEKRKNRPKEGEKRPAHTEFLSARMGKKKCKILPEKIGAPKKF